MPTGRLAEHYLAHRSGPALAIDRQALELTLTQLVDLGGRAWPGISLSAEDFVAQLAVQCPALPDPELRAADVFLACACARGLPAALAAMERAYLAHVPPYLARGGTRPDVAAEVRQLLAQRLLVGTPGRIAEYQGRGSLANWVRAAATRTAMNLVRGERRHGQAVAASTVASAVVGGDPELDFIKARFRPQFKAALREAIAELPARQRAILRLHYGERVGVGQIAASYDVHRATVSRWLHDAQHAILERTRGLLRERLQIGHTECDELVGLVQSRLDVTLSSLLRSSLTNPAQKL